MSITSSIITRRADFVNDIVTAVEEFRSWNLLELDTWDAIHAAVDNVIMTHEGMDMFVCAQASVGLERPGIPKVFIEMDIMWAEDRDWDTFTLFVTPQPAVSEKDVDAYERAMSIL